MRASYVPGKITHPGEEMVNDVRKLCEGKMDGSSISVRGIVFQRPDSLHCIQMRSGVDYDPAGNKMEISSRNAGLPQLSLNQNISVANKEDRWK
jgi:hypothetical protein